MSDNTISFDSIPRTSGSLTIFSTTSTASRGSISPAASTFRPLSRARPGRGADLLARAVADALADQNALAGASDLTFANIERLRQKRFRGRHYGPAGRAFHRTALHGVQGPDRDQAGRTPARAGPQRRAHVLGRVRRPRLRRSQSPASSTAKASSSLSLTPGVRPKKASP